VAHRRPITRVFEAARKPFGDAEAPFDLGQQQHTGIGGQAPTIEGQQHQLAADRGKPRKTQLCSSMAGAHSVAAW